MEKEDKYGQMEHIMKAIGKMECLMAKVSIIINIMVPYIMVFGSKVKDQVLESNYGLIEALMLVNGNKIYNMDMEILNLMEKYTQECGEKVNLTE